MQAGRCSLKEQNGELNQKLATLLEDFKPQAKYLERVVVKNSGRVSFLSVEEIIWIEAAESYVLRTAPKQVFAHIREVFKK